MDQCKHSYSIALLGATGKTGREILRILLTENFSHVHLNIYVRSRVKLEEIFPNLGQYTRVKVFEGPITDVSLVQKCLVDTEIIISVLGQNENIKGQRVLQDAATTTISALQILKSESGEYRPPRLILLSSATWNPKFAAARPAVMHWLIRTAFCYPYADLVRAQSLYSQRPELLDLVLMQPPALVEEEPSGHVISTEEVTLVVSYADLAAGFVEVMASEEHRGLRAVGVSSRAKNQVKHVPELLRRILTGLLALYLS